MRNLKKAVDLIKEFEGCQLTAYKCPAGVWTIGYGQTGNIKKGMKITRQEAEDLLAKDLAKRSVAIEKLLTVKVNDNQFGALLSFAYNLGVGFLKRSELLIMINDGVYDSPEDVALMFGHYNHAGGKVLKGLTRRRAAEAKLYCESV